MPRPLRLFLLFQRALWSVCFRRIAARSPHAHLSFQMELLIRFLELDWRAIKRWPIDRARTDLEARPLPKSATSKVVVKGVTAGGVPAAWVEPSEGLEERVVLYLHGGSYIFGSHRTHADVLARVALASRARVLA